MTKDEIVKHFDEFLGYYYNSPCGGCPEGHASFWKTVIESPQWKAWVESRPSYDISECEALGIMGKEHFQDFMKFVLALKCKGIEEIINEWVDFNINAPLKEVRVPNDLAAKLTEWIGKGDLRWTEKRLSRQGR